MGSFYGFKPREGIYMRHKKSKVPDILRLVRKSTRRLYKSIIKSQKVKVARRLAKMDVSKAVRLTYKFLNFQAAIRPRARLILRVIPALAVAFILTNQAVAYLEPKKTEIKINGQNILVADKADESAKDEVEVSYNVD